MARRWVRGLAGAALATLISYLGSLPVHAAGSGEALPRFAALHSDKVNLRAGPGDRYPIEWVYLRKDWPVEVVAKFDHWRRVRDWEGTEGWVHEKMITSRREVIITGSTRALRQSPDPRAPLVARAEPGVMAQLQECRGDWCRIDAHDTTGWVQRSEIWGVSPTESIP